MGEVYRARDTRLCRDVAVKVLPAAVSNDPKALARFESEAKAVAALSHPNILALFDVGKEGAVSFVVMELLEGETLREALTKGPLPVRKALDIALQMAEGLAAAHGKGIVHRDVKPENVFLTKDGHAKLLDFGLARPERLPPDRDATQSPTVEKLTSEGAVLGTVAYMSPEQARGETVDFRSDQFSLGVVLYEMLTGKRPFGGASAAETLAAIIRDEPEPLTKLDPKLPALLGWIVQRCLSKDPEERYASTKDLARELAKPPDAPFRGRQRGGRLARRNAPFPPPGSLLGAGGCRGPCRGFRSLRRHPIHSIRISSGFAPQPLALLSRSMPHLDRLYEPVATLRPTGRPSSMLEAKLFVRPLDRDEIKPIPGTEGGVGPFFSPDGLWVGFFAEGKLKKVSLAGGLPITLCDALRCPPTAEAGGRTKRSSSRRRPMSGLYRIPASGGESQTLTRADASKLGNSQFPEILPDGEHVLFQIDTWTRMRYRRAAVVSLRTGERRVVVEDAGYPRFLPTGHLVFTRSGSLLAVAFSLKRLEMSGLTVPLLDDLYTNRLYTNLARIAFSSDGTLVYRSSRRFQRTLVWVDRKGAVERVPFPPGGYERVALSPDGGRIAAISREGRNEGTASWRTRPGHADPVHRRGDSPGAGLGAGRKTDRLWDSTSSF